MCSSDCLLVFLAVLFPPLPVWVKRGLCSADSLINIALCMLGFIPGLIHAWYIISVTPDPGYEQVLDHERGTTYIVVHGGSQQGYQRRQGQPSYGTVNSTADAQFPGASKGFVQPPPQPSNAGASSSDPAPPTYQDAVAGDNKVQRS